MHNSKMHIKCINALNNNTAIISYLIQNKPHMKKPSYPFSPSIYEEFEYLINTGAIK